MEMGDGWDKMLRRLLPVQATHQASSSPSCSVTEEVAAHPVTNIAAMVNQLFPPHCSPAALSLAPGALSLAPGPGAGPGAGAQAAVASAFTPLPVLAAAILSSSFTHASQALGTPPIGAGTGTAALRGEVVAVREWQWPLLLRRCLCVM